MGKSERMTEFMPYPADPAASAGRIRRLTCTNRNVGLTNEPAKIVCRKQGDSFQGAGGLSTARIRIDVQHPPILWIIKLPTSQLKSIREGVVKEPKSLIKSRGRVYRIPRGGMAGCENLD